MAGLFLISENRTKIDKLHDALAKLYSIVYMNQNVLKAYDSKRFKQLNQKLLPILGFAGDFKTEKESEEYILKGLRDVGYLKCHPFIRGIIISELEYMLATLRILVEPDFELSLDLDEDESEMIPV